MNVSELDHKLCTGCSLCYNICQFKAINMDIDDEGFSFPVINSNCTECGICGEKCPQISKKSNFNDNLECYAIRCNDEIRLKCSSGGVFGAISEYVINKMHGIVYGSSFDNSWRNLSIVRISSADELGKVYKSKYVQSEVGDIFNKVKKDLVDGIFVLFCGCPCQVDALKSYLGIDYKNLVTIDILCHGVPSPLAYNKYLDEVSEGKDIKSVDFRDKKYGWGTLIGIKFSNDEVYYDYYNGDYFRAFLSGLSMRESCFNCKYSQIKRVGDITLGDFWGIKEYKANLDDKKGTSLVMCNTLNGKNLIEMINDFIFDKELIDLKIIANISKRTNAALLRPTYRPKMRQCFFNHLKMNDSFSKSLKYAETSLIDIGILGWWIETSHSNYGSTLTNFALYRYLLSLGLSVAFISPPNFDRKNAGEFNKKYGYRMTAQYNYANMKENNKYIDSFIVGSDVLWYYDAFIKTGYFFMLDFVNSDKRKISYSTSFGNTKNFIPIDEISKIKTLLKRFDNISVREKEAIKICKDRLDVNATLVLDPVFLCDLSNWYELSNNALRKTKDKFLFSYILDPNSEKIESLQKISKKLNLKLVTITDKQFNPEEKESLLINSGIINNASVEELIYHIQNAEYVITDSYHGMCFSLLLKKNYYVLVNISRGATRFESLAELINVKDRMLYDSSNLLKCTFKELDYLSIDRRLNDEIEKSKEWLKNALFSKKKITKMSNIDSINYSLVKMEGKISKIEYELEIMKTRKKD